MQQRVVIAIALASDPKLLVLDEPTTGLDATVEASVLDLVRSLQAETNAAVLLIAHNLGVIRTLCDRVGVMYAGKIVEEGDAGDRLRAPGAPVHAGPAPVAAPPRHPQVAARAVDDPGQPAPDRDEPADLRLRRPLPARDRAVPDRRAADRRASGPAAGRAATIATGSARSSSRRPSSGQDTVHGEPGRCRSTHVSKTFHQSGHDVPALVKVDLELFDGETLGLVGESGSGKSTLAKTILGIESPDAGGNLELGEHALAPLSTERPTDDKRSIQMVFQNPDFGAQPRLDRAAHPPALGQKLTGLKGKAVDERVDKLAADLRLTQRHLDLKPRQLSGGLKQRLAIARAFAGDPKIVVADEPTSALDVSVQAAILNLLSELQLRSKTSYLLISHDLGVVRYLADRIAVMYLGRIMEVGDSETVFRGPNHPYTEALLSAVPNVDGEAARRGSCSRARSRARPTRRPAASSTPAAPGSSAACAR